MSSSGAIKGRYEKRQVLGEGGMGIVYRAYDADLKREVALKTLRDGGDELALEMFRKECGVLASLNHPNIVDIYDVGQFEEDGVEKPYFVMPLLPGTTLDRIIKGEPQRLTVERTVEIIAQTCRGLQAAHERGLIHRDLKPSNIFVLADDTVKIIDFGIAHLTGTHTSLGLKGTVYYMAPEQMEMKPASAQSDIYSLAVVCFEILGRRRPFIGSNRDEVIRAILRGSPPPVNELNPLVAQTLGQVIHAGLAKKPYHRFQTSREFADNLQKALRNQPLERFNPEKVEPRIQKVEKALTGQEFEFANEILSELEEEGQLHPAIRSLRNRLDTTIRDRTISQLIDSARRRLEDNEYQLALQKVQEVLQLDPRHAGALGLRADIESRRSTEQIDGWVRLARQHLDNQKFSLAREALGNALAINPQDTSASGLRAEIERNERTTAEARSRKRELYDQAQEAWQRGDVTAALSKIERVIDVDRQAQGGAALEGDLAATYQTFYNKVRSEHDTIKSSYEEAKNHVANGNFAAAATLCDEILARHPDHTLFQALRFDIGEGQRQALSADMARVDREVDAEPDLDRRVKILEEAMARHPGEVHFKHALQGVSSKRDLVNSIASKARSLEETGHFQEAISQWDILRSIYPQFPGLDFEIERLKKRRQQQSRLDAKARWAERIDGALNGSDHPRALELVASALGEFPGDAELTALEKLAQKGLDKSREGHDLIARGQELRQSGKLAEAVAVLQQAVALDERNAAARGALVEALVAQAGTTIEQDHSSADQWIDQALSLDAGHTQARSLKTLVGDKRREAGVNDAIARARELQTAGNIKAAYQEVLAGLAAYPLDNRLTQLKNQLSKSFEEVEKAPQVQPPPPPPPALPAPIRIPPPTAKLSGKEAKKKHQQQQPQAAPTPAAIPVQPPPPARAVEPTSATQKATSPKPSTPPAVPPPPGKKTPLWIAAVAIPLLGAIGWFALKPPPPPPPPVEANATRVTFEVVVNPASARLRVADKDFGASRTLDLEAGDYQLEVYGEGIKTMRVPIKVSNGMPALAPIQAEVEPPTLVLALSGARATLDGKLVTAQGAIVIEPGDHRMEFFQGIGRGVVEFNITPGAAPVVKNAAASQMFLAAVSVLGKSGKLFGAKRGGLGAAELADLPPTGLDLTGLTEAPQPVRVSDGIDTRSYDLTSSVAPAMLIFVADPGRVDLAVLSNEEGAIVQINGRQSGVIQKGLRLEQLAPGVYRVKVSKPGFAEVPERTVTLVKGRGLRELFELKAAMGSLRIVGAVARAQVSIDGKPAGETKPGEPFTLPIELGRHRIGLKADSHVATDRDADVKAGSDAVFAWRDLLTGTGSVQLSVSGANLSVSYSPAAGGASKAAAPGSLTLPVGDYTFRAMPPGGPEQTKPVSVRLGQSVAVSFEASSRSTQPIETKSGGSNPGGALPSLLSEEWKDDDGWKKLDGGKQFALPGSVNPVTFQVRRRGGLLGGKPGWLFVASQGGFVRFELGGDKLTWWVTQGNNRDKKIGDAQVAKDAEEVRIEIGADSITHTIGGVPARVTASELGFNNFSGGHLRLRGPIWIKGIRGR